LIRWAHASFEMMPIFPDFRSFLKADASKAFVYKGCIFLGTTFNFYL
jgi:hypothetical protein